MKFEANIEILGKLATLGAAPIRRRTTEKFAEFARNIQAQFALDVRANPSTESAADVTAGLHTRSITDARDTLRTQTKKDRQ
jgi:hypothetical protein